MPRRIRQTAPQRRGPSSEEMKRILQEAAEGGNIAAGQSLVEANRRGFPQLSRAQNKPIVNPQTGELFQEGRFVETPKGEVLDTWTLQVYPTLRDAVEQTGPVKSIATAVSLIGPPGSQVNRLLPLMTKNPEKFLNLVFKSPVDEAAKLLVQAETEIAHIRSVTRASKTPVSPKTVQLVTKADAALQRAKTAHFDRVARETKKAAAVTAKPAASATPGLAGKVVASDSFLSKAITAPEKFLNQVFRSTPDESAALLQKLNERATKLSESIASRRAAGESAASLARAERTLKKSEDLLQRGSKVLEGRVLRGTSATAKPVTARAVGATGEVAEAVSGAATAVHPRAAALKTVGSGLGRFLKHPLTIAGATIAGFQTAGPILDALTERLTGHKTLGGAIRGTEETSDTITAAAQQAQAIRTAAQSSKEVSFQNRSRQIQESLVQNLSADAQERVESSVSRAQDAALKRMEDRITKVREVLGPDVKPDVLLRAAMGKRGASALELFSPHDDERAAELSVSSQVANMVLNPEVSSGTQEK